MRLTAPVLFAAALVMTSASAGCDKKADPAPASVDKPADDKVGEPAAKVADAPEPEATAPSAAKPEAAKPSAAKPEAAKPEAAAETAKVEAGADSAGKPADAPAAVDNADDAAVVEGAKPADAPAEGEAAAAPAVKLEPGPAYFGLGTRGIVKLEDGKFTSIGQRLPFVKNMALDTDGTLWLASSGVVSINAKGEQSKHGDYKVPGSVSDIAVAPDGTVWVAGFKGVGSYDGKAWTMIEKSALGIGDKGLLDAISVDAKGRVWLQASKHLVVGNAGTWKAIEFNGKYLKGMALHPATGTAWTSVYGKLLKTTGGELQQVPFTGRGMIADLVMGASGTLYGKNSSALFALAADGTMKQWAAEEGAFKAKSIRTVGIDGSERIWADTDGGLVVIDNAGKVTQYPTGSIPGVTTDILGFAMFGAGPVLPPVGEVMKGSLQGKLAYDGKPVASGDVELCKNPSMTFQKTPCTDAPWKGTAKTTEDGSFIFNDVPLGSYGLAIKRDAESKWSRTFSSVGEKMAEGQTFDIGTITLKKK